MAGFTLRRKLAMGEQVFAAWLASGHPRVAEATLRAGFDTAIFDIQHGEATLAEVRDGIAAARLAGKPSGVRVGLNGVSDAARALDLGAELAILPMVNSAEDATAFVEALKYPPLGSRSYGPARGAELLGLSLENYRTTANENIIALAMVETRAAVDALEAILEVPHLDGVFIGPSDLSLSLSDGTVLDPQLPESVTLMKRAISLAKKRGKITGIYCAGGAMAARNAQLGFDILAIGSDYGFLADGARRALELSYGSDNRSR